MKKELIVAMLFLFASIGITLAAKAWAASPQQVAQEGKGCSVPKEWGQLKGVADKSVAFEDQSGNIRVLDLGPCMRGETRLIVTIKRL